MSVPPLLSLPDEAAYRRHFDRAYVHGSPVVSPDGIIVRFYPERFDHAFYKKSSRQARRKDTFDFQRAERMDWIRAVLTDPCVERYRDIRKSKGLWCVVVEPTTPYVVVFQLMKAHPPQARFITAFVVDKPWEYLLKVRRMPWWQLP